MSLRTKARDAFGLKIGDTIELTLFGEAIEAIPPHDPAVVEFVGPRANPYPHMRRFDVATLPSRDDPFPLVVLEAMLLGTPVVAFAVGSVADQIGSAGVIVPAIAPALRRRRRILPSGPGSQTQRPPRWIHDRA